MTDISPKDVREFLDEVESFTKKIIETKCMNCPEYKYGNNYECFCVEVLDMLSEHPKAKRQCGYEDFVCKSWNIRQRRQEIARYGA